jgi:[histone H3]-trimethyl-L-lysine9/36 demethylase
MAEVTNALCLRRSSRTLNKRLRQSAIANSPAPANLDQTPKNQPPKQPPPPPSPLPAIASEMDSPALIAEIATTSHKVSDLSLDGLMTQNPASKKDEPSSGEEVTDSSDSLDSPNSPASSVLSVPASQTPSLEELPPWLDDDDDDEDPKISYERDWESGGILLLKPTVEQWGNFKAVLSQARNLNSHEYGCFKVRVPEGTTGPLPARPARTDDANAFKPHLIKGQNNYRVHTIMDTASFPATPTVANADDYLPPRAALEKLRKLFSKHNRRQVRKTRYRVDVPAWTPEQRLAAGVPERSPIHPLQGDRLDKTKAIIPGIHTPYVYESGGAFGATFQIHAEDYRLLSLNHLYLGRKIWVIVPSLDVDRAEEKLGRGDRCSQFMRHRAEFFFPAQLDKLGIPYHIIDQRPGETIVILQDAYHEGFSDGYTLAEAKNYADAHWNASSYQPCNDECKLATAIPSAHMKLVGDDEERIDLCTAYLEEVNLNKRSLDDTETEDESSGMSEDSKADISTADLPRPAKMSRLC